MQRTANFVSATAGALAFAALVGLSACSPAAQKSEAPAAKEEASAPAPTAPATPTAPVTEAKLVETQIKGPDGKFLQGDITAGEKVFRQCAACHALQAGVNRTGPSLHGIVGRKAGSVEGFRYSDANKNSGKVWTEENMFTYLENPRGVIPGTIMAFAGLKKPEDRVNVIAYIQENSK